MPMIEAEGLARTFRSRNRTVEAVRGVDLTVDDGEIVGFLGPNGAGKTTTLRMLTTLLTPTAGRATVAGADLLHDPVGVRRRIGYVPQAIGQTGGGSDPNAQVGEELTLQARLYRVPAAEVPARTALVARQLELAGLEPRLVKTLSGGQRRRLDIALGLVHRPGLVFLDEPTTGLDPQSRSNLWEHIRGLRDSLGTTVFLTTHYLDEADALCDRVLIIDNGRIVAGGTPDELKRRVSGLLIQLGLFGAAFVGFTIISDWRFGVIERLRVTPVSRLAILAGRVLRDVVTLFVQAVVLVLAGVAFGLRAPLPGVLIGLAFIAVVAVSLAAVSYTVGLLTKSEDVLAPALNMVMVPLMLLSGIMLPLVLGPGWLQAIGRATPFRYIIDAMRAGYAGHYLNAVMLEGVAVSIGLAVVCLWLAGRVFIRENA